ncbi:MAG: AAA family ATPase [Candidatus Eisenbacteria bacterium]|nr:AAA family ATPase [Candidatus Eisenbacteria bacterium]
MRILRIEIEGFGPFASPRSIRFSERGLNIVYGGNESGKSTLVEAIYATVFGVERKDTEQSFQSWSPSRGFTGLVEFGVVGGTVRFLRDFSSNKVTVTRTENGNSKELFSGDASPRSRSDRSDEKRAYLELLRQLFGFSDGALARQTSIVRQLHLETEFTPGLRGLISGAGSTDYNGAIELLKARFDELTTENPWGRVARRKMRAIEEVQDKLNKAQADLETAEGFFSRNINLAGEAGELQTRIKGLREKCVQKREFLSKIGRLVELQNILKEKRKLLRSEQSAKEDYEKVKKTCEGAREKLCKEYPSFARLETDISSTLSRAVSVEGEVGLAERELSDKEAQSRVAPRPIPGWAIAAVSLGILIVSLVVGVLNGKLGLTIGVGAAVAIAVYIGLYLLSRSRRRKLPDAASLEASGKRLSSLREEEARLREEVCRSFPDEETRARVGTLRMLELAGQYARFREAKKTVEDFERQLLERKAEAEVEAGARERTGGDGYSAALSDAAVGEAKLEQFLKEHEELFPLKDDSEKAAVMAARAKAEIESTEKELAELEGKLTETRIEHARVSASPVSPPEVYQDEIERLRESLARLTLRRDALRLAVQILEECVAQYQAESIERIAGRISKVFKTLTQERYKAVRLSPELEPLLETSAEKEIAPEQISTGAHDQLYFSMRIAMIEELSGEKGLPLILDDPFVNFDDERLERARALLADLAGERDTQVIIFTHGDRHLTWDANVIRLS